MPAPIVVFAHNRPLHVARTLAALAENPLAAESALHVFCDGDPAQAAVREAREAVRAARGFRSVRIVEQQARQGLARSVIAGVTEVVEQHGRVIAVEDDLIVARSFLAFMNAALERYEREPRVFSVTGFTPPVTPPEGYPSDAYAFWRCSSWGWGTWADRWRKIDWSRMEGDPRLARGGSDLPTQLGLLREGRVDSWAVRFCLAHALNDAVCMYPVRSLVTNIGLDRSGTHSVPDARLAGAPAEDVGQRFPDDVSVLPQFARQRLAFHAEPLARRARRLIGRLLGR